MAKIRILTVEDDAETATLIYRYLYDLGYDCVGIVATGEEAIMAVAETQPDLVLMDIQLSGSMDGISAAMEIDSRHDVPIVFLTAHADHHTVNRAKLSKPHGYIVKPFEENSLRAGVELAVYRHTVEREVLRQHKRLDATLNGLDDAVMITDAAGTLVYMNKTSSEYTGLHPSEAEGHPLAELMEFYYRDGGHRLINPAADALLSPTDRHPPRPYVIKTGGGILEQVDLAALTLRNDSGMLLGAALVFRLTGDALPGEFEDRIRHVYSSVFTSIQSLGGAVALCAWCKKIKDTSGKWVPADPFLLRYASRWITHGICPECEAKVMCGEAALES